MANVQWQISGEYFEACNCDSVCPCPTSGLAARPTKGACDAGLVFDVQRGQYASTKLDGLSFAVLLHTPGPMIQGNWTVGLVVDERASQEQRDALTTIASGQGGGPMVALRPAIAQGVGAESRGEGGRCRGARGQGVGGAGAARRGPGRGRGAGGRPSAGARPAGGRSGGRGAEARGGRKQRYARSRATSGPSAAIGPPPCP